MNSPQRLCETREDRELEKDNRGEKTLSTEEFQTQSEKEISMKEDQGMEGELKSGDKSLAKLFGEECHSLQECGNHKMNSPPQKIFEKKDQEKEKGVDSGFHSPMRMNEEVQETKESYYKETNSMQKISGKEDQEIEGAVDRGVNSPKRVGEEIQETTESEFVETNSVQNIFEKDDREIKGGADSGLYSLKKPFREADSDIKELNSPQRLAGKKDEDTNSDDDLSHDEVYSLVHLFEEDVQEHKAGDDKEKKHPEKIPEVEDQRLMIDDERRGKLGKDDNQEACLFTQSSIEKFSKKMEGTGSKLWNRPVMAKTKVDITLAISSNLKTLKLPPSEEIHKQMKKMACGQCNKYCLYWNVCKICNIFLCDVCFSICHSPILQHKITRYIAFSEFGCPTHVQISKYFCLDCISPRCEGCKKERCREHYLITRDKKDNIGLEKVNEGDFWNRARTKEQTSTVRQIKNASSGIKHYCKYCNDAQEQCNLCKDCMEFFCDFCLALYHPKGHTVCKGVSFSMFACAKHKVIYRYFCDKCKKLRCDECIVLEKLCSEHASSLHKSGEHMALEKGKETPRFEYNSDVKESEFDCLGNGYGNSEPRSKRNGNVNSYLDLLRNEGPENSNAKVEQNQLVKKENRDTKTKSDECTQANGMNSRQHEKSKLTLPTSEEKWNVDHFCKFCKLKFELYNICEDCMIYFCDRCWIRYHPSDHTICRSKPFGFFGCSEHINLCSYFCEDCKSMRCDDCVLMNGKCSEHKITKLLKYVSKEKEVFDGEMQNFFSNNYQTINFLSEQLDRAENSILLTKLQNEETLRQEFASLRLLITEREQRMWSDLEQEYKLQRRNIRQQRRAIGLYVKEDSTLLSMSLTSRETSSLLSFHSDAQEIWGRLKNLKRRLKKLQSPADIVELPLASEFSLCKEKQELSKSLRLRKPGELKISSLAHTVYFDDPTKPLCVRDLVTMTDPTISNCYKMYVEIRKSVRRVIWHSDCCSVDDYIANVEGRITFESNSRYLIKIFLDTTTLNSKYIITQRNAKPKYVLLVTGRNIPMDIDDDSYPHLCNIIGLQTGVQERIRLRAMYFGRDYNPFVPINDEIISFEERRYFEPKYCLHTSGSKPQTKAQSLKNAEKFESLGMISRRFFPVNTLDGRFICMSAMEKYKKFSLEELRLQDYKESGAVSSVLQIQCSTLS